MKRKNTISLLKVCFSFTLGLLAFKDAEGACAWPAVFQSSAWRDSGKGDIFFDISSMTGWSIFTVDTSTTVQEWECLSASTFDTDGRLIMITASSFQLFGNTNYYAYLCITFTKITDYSYRYYINHDIVSVLHDQRLFIYTVDTLSDVGTICSDTSGAMGSEYQVWVKGNSESLAKIDCPWSFLGRYRYEHTTYDNVQSCDITTSEVSTCSNTMEMQFDYTACATKVAYSNSDTVWCVANVVASGNNYVTVYNGNDADSDIDDINTYRFTCFAIFDNASQASVSPRHCQRDQTPNHIPITNSDDEIGALLQFSPAIETCPTCPELVDPDRGNVAIETMDTSTTATYTCDSPYSLVGVSLRTCQTNGTWTGSAPYCGCASPPSLSNGALSINNDGTIATYTCDMGYTIDGLSTRNCQISTAMWEGNDPTCVECEAIPTLSGRSYSFSRTSSGTVTVVTFTCLSGYTLSGTSSLTCQSDGTWSDSLPLCAACEVLTNPQSGFVVISSANSISTAAYTCSTGYSLIGDQTRTCQADGTWDGSQPNCQCTTPSSPANGNVLSDGVTATYTCSLNYTLNGDSTRTCGADGSGWSGSDPTCVACSSISTVTGGTVTLSTSGTVTTARYTCDLGYSLDGSSTITCLSSGSWDFTEPQCAECPILTDPASGTVTISTSGTSTSATYACASGYNLNGFTIRLCDSNGDWSLTEPTCTCQSPPQITNGLMITDGQTATYTCNLRYSLNGVRTRTCNTDGSGWTDSDPTCEMCESLHAPNGGTIDFSTDNYNTVATFTCGTGYTLNGTTPITCQSDGTWESNQPICANCPDLSNPSSGSVSLSILNDVTTVATFTCASGYYLSGDFQLTCQSDATWSSTDPMCKCNFPPTPSNGVVSVSDGSSGILATYTCSEGYTLSGLSTRQCLTDGTGWEGSDPTCEVCQAVGIVTFGSFTLTSNNTHTRVTFRCNVGTTINGESEGACLEDGTWDNPEPTCVSCPDISNPDSGTVSLSTTGLVTTATYTCASGYSLTSDGTLLCQTDGTWDNSPPTCVCTAAPVLQNGQVNTSSDFSEATYSCDTGYVLVGSSVRYCQNDGTGWNGTQPTCDATVTAAPSTEEDSETLSLHIAILISLIVSVLLVLALFTGAMIKYLSLRKELKISSKPAEKDPKSILQEPTVVSRPGTSKSIRFADGTKEDNAEFRPESKASASDVLIVNGIKPLPSKTTTSNGVAGRPSTLPPTGHQFKSSRKNNALKNNPNKKNSPLKRLPSPKRKKGGRPMTPIEQRMTDVGVDRVKTPDLLSSAPFGYINPVFCYEAETPLPDIANKECPTLQNPTGGFITLISDGETTTANYLCSSGYTLSGESFLTCQKDQTWDAAIPTCVQCKSLGTPLSTIVSTKTDGHVTTVSFSCVAGYTLVGPDSSTCFSNGSWNSSTPDCKCNNPPVVQNGAVIADGQTASYTCSQGFTLSGSQYRTCLTDGTGWSDTDPSCVQCAILANPVGGSFTLSTSGTMTSASFKCESGYSLSGHSTISCQSNGTWEAIPNCTECQEIDIPSNADLSITTTGTVSMVTYTCAPGYEMNGVSTRTCFSDGVWNGSTPTCSCQDPSQPTNGQVFADGHTATYLCSTGYTLDGPSVRTCAADGTGWNGTDPFCIKCADLSTIEGGKFELTTNGLQSTVSYTCYVGYTLNGTNSMTCFNTGSWNDTEPECVLCPTLSDPDSGSVTITTDGYTSSATFMCASGYYVNGLSTFDCLTSGQWAESSPACKCNLPSQPADGVVSVSDTVHGQMANYTCNTGYTLFGLSSRLCLSDGTGWEGDDPTCTSCILSTTPPEMSAELSTNGIVTIITYRCTLNYTLSGTSVQICQSDGTWSDIIPSCILCPTVISPGGGSVSIATDGLVTSISYTCDVGYTLSGAAELSCTINGNLNGSMPSCVLCPALSQPDSGGVSLSTDGYVTMATFTCQTGYYLSGQSSFTCLSSGVWNGDPPTCECNFPLSPANGAVSVKDTTDDTVAEYTCMTNYTLSGSSTRVCQNDGSGWTGTEPSCVSCNLTSTPSDSTAAFSSNGTVSMVMYTCALGFTLSGTPIQTCQPDGTWSDTLPICAACPTLSDPSSGTVALSTNGYITTATFTCVSGYYLSGQSSISCQTNGLWNGNPPTCECNFPASPSNGDVSVKDTISGTVAEYTCNTNYSLSGSPSRVCQDDGTGWTGTEPICVQCSMIDAEIPLGVTITTSGTVTSLAYSCSVNYTLVGISLQTCSSNGTWTSTPPICEPCNPKSSLESGSISFSSNGSVTQASFMCVQGYSLNSSSSAICLPDGTWVRADPVCICDPPVAPSNGDITVSSDGRYANYSCAKEYMLVGTIERFCLNNGTGWNGTDPTCELIAAVSGASTEDSSTFPLHIGLFIFLMIALVVLIGLVGFCAYRRFKAERPPSKIGATYDKNKVISTPEREKSFGTDKISKDMEEGKTFLISKPSDKKQTFDVRNLTPTPPNEVPNVKFDSDRPTQIVIRNGIASKPPELPPRSAKSNVNVPLSSVRLPKLKSQPPQRHNQPRPKKRRKKKPPAQENLISGSSESSTPIDIVIDPGNTPDISSTDLDYIQPVHLRNVPIPESGRPSTSSTLKSRPNTSVNRKKQVSGQNGKIGEN